MDLLIQNARVIDGTGSPWFRGHVGVEDNQIAAIDRTSEPTIDADKIIDINGSILCPGFIDVHSHSDLQMFNDPQLSPKTRQGVTTEILGQDGFSMAPIYDGNVAAWRQHLTALAGDVDREWTWGSVEDYLNAVEANGVGPNIATLVGHGTVRYELLGMADRDPTEEELSEMCSLVRDALEDGAIGFSTGLVYPPHVNAGTEEVRQLAAELTPYGRPFVAHIRSEGRWIWEALDEFIDIGASENVPLHLSHYKVSGLQQQWKADRANGQLEAARERGVDITADQYPYTAGNTMLSSILPPWVHTDGPDKLIEQLQDPDVRDRIRRDFDEWRIDGWENHGVRTGWENIVVTNIQSTSNAKYEGCDLASIATERDMHPSDIVCDFLVEEELQVTMILHALREDDVREILRNDSVTIATDGLFGQHPHPRVYGSYPRVLGHYVRDKNVLSLPNAIRKMTALPARAMGLYSKGVIRLGMDADLVVFDPVRVGSPATYDSPRQYPTGITDVIVNGSFVVRDGELTDNTPGRAIRQT